MRPLLLAALLALAFASPALAAPRAHCTTIDGITTIVWPGHVVSLPANLVRYYGVRCIAEPSIPEFAAKTQVVHGQVMTPGELGQFNQFTFASDQIQNGFLRDNTNASSIGALVVSPGAGTAPFNVTITGTALPIFPYTSGAYSQTGTANSYLGATGTDTAGGVNPLRTDIGNGILNVSTSGQTITQLTANNTCTLASGSTGHGRLYEVINAGAAQTLTLTITDSTTVCTSPILYGPVILGQGQVITLNVPYGTGLMYIVTGGAPGAGLYLVRQ